MIDSPIALLAVLAIFVAVPLVLRRHRSQAPDAVRVLGRTALAKGAVVAVVAVGDRRMLVGAGDKGVQMLADLDHAGEAVAATDRVSAAPLPVAGAFPLDRKDAVRATPSTSTTLPPHALAGLEGLEAPSVPGPGIGLVDRLRARTVRTPVKGRPLHVPFRT